MGLSRLPFGRPTPQSRPAKRLKLASQDTKTVLARERAQTSGGRAPPTALGPGQYSQLGRVGEDGLCSQLGLSAERTRKRVDGHAQLLRARAQHGGHWGQVSSFTCSGRPGDLDEHFGRLRFSSTCRLCKQRHETHAPDQMQGSRAKLARSPHDMPRYTRECTPQKPCLEVLQHLRGMY